MPRFVLLVLAAAAVAMTLLRADDDQGPPISITSPDTGTTFDYGTIKQHSLRWDKRSQTLVARVIFTDQQQELDQPNDDQLESGCLA